MSPAGFKRRAIDVLVPRREGSCHSRWVFGIPRTRIECPFGGPIRHGDVGEQVDQILGEPVVEAPAGYADFDGGVARKYVIDPHGAVPAGPRSSDAHRKTAQ